jgi:hypothetical protein
MPCREVGIPYPILHQEPLSRHFILMICGALTFASSRDSFQKNTFFASTTSRKCIIAKNRGMQEAEARRWCLQCHKRCECHGGREIFDSWDPPSKLDRLPSCKSLPRSSPTTPHHSSPLLLLHPHPQKQIGLRSRGRRVGDEPRHFWVSPRLVPSSQDNLRSIQPGDSRCVSVSPPPLPYNSLETSG